MLRLPSLSVGSFLIAGLVLFAGPILFADSLAAQDSIDVRPASREVIEALQRALQPAPNPNYDDAPPGPPLADPAYAEAPLLAPAEDEDAPTAAQSIQYEVSIVHVASGEDFSEEEMAISDETAVDQVAAWKEQGKVARASTYRFQSVHDEAAFVQVAEQAPVVTSRASFGGGRGPSQTETNYQEVGTLVGATGRVQGNRVVLEIDVEQSRLEPTTTPVQPTVVETGAGDPAPQEALGPPTTKKINSQTTVIVPDGETVVLSANFQKSEAGSTGTVITLRATIRF